MWTAEIRALWDEASTSQDHDLTKVLAKAEENQANHAKVDAFGLFRAQQEIVQANQFAASARTLFW